MSRQAGGLPASPASPGVSHFGYSHKDSQIPSEHFKNLQSKVNTPRSKNSNNADYEILIARQMEAQEEDEACEDDTETESVTSND